MCNIRKNILEQKFLCTYHCKNIFHPSSSTRFDFSQNSENFGNSHFCLSPWQLLSSSKQPPRDKGSTLTASSEISELKSQQPGRNQRRRIPPHRHVPLIGWRGYSVCPLRQLAWWRVLSRGGVGGGECGGGRDWGGRRSALEIDTEARVSALWARSLCIFCASGTFHNKQASTVITPTTDVAEATANSRSPQSEEKDPSQSIIQWGRVSKIMSFRSLS